MMLHCISFMDNMNSFLFLFSEYCFLFFNSCQVKLLAKLFPSLFLKHFLKSSNCLFTVIHCFFHLVSFAHNFFSFILAL